MFVHVDKKAIGHIYHVLKIQLNTKLLTSTGLFVSRVRANFLTRLTCCYFTFHKNYLNNLLLNGHFVLSLLDTFHTPKRHYRFQHHLHHYIQHRRTWPHYVGLGSVPEWSTWDFWWKNWHWDRFLCKYFGSSPSVISPVLHVHSYSDVHHM